MTNYPLVLKRFSQLSFFLMVFLLGACSDKKASPPPPPEVSVIYATPTTIGLTDELSGRIEASRKAEIRARVPGVLLQRLFQEGSEVQAGANLFKIDDAPYQADLAKAKANLSKAQSDLNRMRPLMSADAISKQEFDQVLQAYRLAKADVTSAEVNVGYAHIKAPISGRIGRSLVTEGALVGQGTPTLLAVIQQNNPVYVNMTQSATDVMKINKDVASGKLQQNDGHVPVTIVLEDGTEYEHKGQLLFADPTVDEATGQISLRAEVPNPDGLLFPGLFVKVVLSQAQEKNVILIPMQAVTRGSQGDSVIVINKDGSFAPRDVVISRSYGQQWVVTEGIKTGEMVMVEGHSKLLFRPEKLTPKPWTLDAKNSQEQKKPEPQKNTEKQGSK